MTLKPLGITRQSTMSAGDVRRLVDDATKIVTSPDLDKETKLAQVRAAIRTIAGERDRDGADLEAASAVVRANIGELEQQAALAIAAAKQTQDSRFFGLGRLVQGEPEVMLWNQLERDTDAERDRTGPIVAEVNANASALFELRRMERELGSTPEKVKNANDALARWRGVAGSAVLLGEQLEGSQAVTDAFLSLTSLNAHFNSKTPAAKALELLSFVVAGAQTGAEALRFAKDNAVWSTEDGLRAWQEGPTAALALARALGTPAAAAEAMRFERNEARWGPNDDGVRAAWSESAKALVALVHVIAGADKAAAAMRFQWDAAKWGADSEGFRKPWAELPKAIVMLAHSLDATKTAEGLRQINQSASPASETSRALLALSHGIAGPLRTTEALSALSTDPSLRQLVPTLKPLERDLLVLHEAFRKTPDAELPLERSRLSVLLTALSALTHEA